MRNIYGLALIALLALAACTTTPVACKDAPDRDACIVDLAVQQHDSNVCSTLGEKEQVWCFTDVATATNDTAVCDLITNEESRNFCKRDIFIDRQDTEACQTLPERQKNDCLYTIARATDDWLTCESMSPGARREECVDRISRKMDDPYGCLRLSEENPRREGCIYVTSIRSSTPATCAELVDNQLRRLCYVSIATNANNTEDCAALPGEFKDFCEGQFEE